MSHDRKSAESIVFLPSDQVIEINSNQSDSILKVAVENDVPIQHSCGGSGSCGTCLVNVVEGLELFAPREFPEKEMAEDRGFAVNERLACQNRACAGMVVEVPYSESVT